MERYKVLELIGEGSFGRVFRGQERDTGRIVALKLIPKVGKRGPLLLNLLSAHIRNSVVFLMRD